VARLTTYLNLESLEIQRSGFDLKSNLTSVVGNLANRNILASYVSRPNAIAYDTAISVALQQSASGVGCALLLLGCVDGWGCVLLKNHAILLHCIDLALEQGYGCALGLHRFLGGGIHSSKVGHVLTI
jgi:hypothetical protein